MISEKELLVNKFVSVPQGMRAFNCGTFVAGIVKGVLDGVGFPARVTTHFVAVEGQARPRTTILIKFAEEVFYFSSFRSFRSITSFVCEHCTISDIKHACLTRLLGMKVEIHQLPTLPTSSLRTSSPTSGGLRPLAARLKCVWRHQNYNEEA